MTSEIINGEMLSESEARELLSQVQGFRQEWAQFAVQSREQFDSFRDKGDSLPESFFRRYAELQRVKETIATRIAERTVDAQRVDWQPPVATESLHDFETRLQDLIDVCRELDRIAQEKYRRYMRVLNEVQGLRCVDVELDQHLLGVREVAASECRQLGPRSVRLADLDLEKCIADCESLLLLIGDARARLVGDVVPQQGLGAARCLQVFQAVCQRFGLPIAVEALRGGFSFSSTSIDMRAELVPSLSDSDDAGSSPAGLMACRSISECSHSEPMLATREQIAQLIVGQSSYSSVAVGSSTTSGKRSPQVPARSVERIRISELTRVALLLEEDAKKLEMGSGCSKRFEGSADVLQVRLKGFKNLAQSLRFAVEFFGDPQPKAEVDGQLEHDFLQVMAEIQSAVRVEALQAEIAPIEAQVVAFNWLRQECALEARGIMLHRYMKLDDWADPSAHDRLCRELLSISRGLEATRRRARAMRELRKSCSSILRDYEQYGEENNPELWSQVDKSIRQLVQGELKPNDAGVRELLLPLIDLLPEPVTATDSECSGTELEMSREFQLVAESVLDFVETDGAQPDVEQELHDEELNPNVARVRELLRGRILVVVGGVCKPHARKRLIKALQLEDVRWLTARKQDRVSTFRSRLTGAAAVILLTKVIGHKHNDLRDMCREMEIPCAQTRVSSGYSVNQIASVILEQVSDQLSAQCAGQLI